MDKGFVVDADNNKYKGFDLSSAYLFTLDSQGNSIEDNKGVDYCVGKSLYASKGCKGCHGQSKDNSSVALIKSAINNKSSMSQFKPGASQALSDQDIKISLFI